MSLRKTKRKLINTENESEDLFSSPKKSQRTPNKKSKKDDSDILKDTSLFGELVTKAGYILKKGDQPNILTCDQAIFQKKLRWSLKSHPIYKMPDIAEKFVKDFENHVEDPLRLKWALLYTQTDTECESARGGHQDSLVRLCLNTEDLQPTLIKFLTEKLLEVAYTDESSNAADIPCLVMANLKWLDHVVDAEVLTEKIIELLEGSPPKVQQEVITFVPFIVDDANHPKIAKVLCDLYNYKPELTSAILDTLGDLTLEPESLEDVRHSVLKTLQAARPEQLPIVTKFLLQSTPQAIAYQVVSDMREKINLPGDYIGTQSTPKGKGNPSVKKTDADAYEVLLLAKIKMATLIYKFLTNAWLKAIQDADDAASVRPLDFILLVVLYDAAPSRQHAIESIFRNKIRTGIFSDTMLEKVFDNHRTVLKEYFTPVQKLASLLLRSPEPAISQTASTVFKSCFVYLDGYQKQEIVLTLLSHLGDNSNVRMAALTTLSTLAHEHTAEMSKFVIFLKGSLDMVDTLNMGEVKRLLDVVSRLAYSDPSHAALQDELAILVRKQLSHSEIKYKLIGVITAVLCVKNMVNMEDNHSRVSGSVSQTTNSDLDSSLLKEAENLLLLVLSSTKKSSTATALFMDEMASIILKEGMNAKLEEWICDKMTNDFQDTFILDIAADSQPPEDLLPQDVLWNLESNDDERQIVLNLSPMVIKLEATRSDPFDTEGELVYLASQFRLLRMLESRLHEGDLCNIDALLGCPLYGPRQDVFDKFESLSQKEQHAALSCLFFAINWFRELINAFVTQKDPDLKRKLHARLRQVIELEQLLWQKLPKCPGYTPPLAVFDLDTSMLTLSLNLTTKKKTKAKRGRKPTVGKGKKGKGKGKENMTEGTQIGTQGNSQAVTQGTPQQTVATQAEEKEPSEEEQTYGGVDPSSCRPFFRELHFDVFGLLFRKLSVDPESKDVGYMTVPELEFLLTDLNMKLTHMFNSGKRATVLGNGAEKGIGYSHLDLFTPVEVATRAHSYLKPVCVHLEAISGFFQNLIADNDGIIDAPGMYSDRTQPFISANSLLLTTLNIFLSWSGLQKEENNGILLAVFRTMAKRLEGNTVSGMEQDELTSVSFRYLSKFHESIVSIDAATTLIQALVSLTVFPCVDDLKEKLVEVTEELLKREWYSKGGAKERGSVFNQHIHTLLETYLKHGSNTLQLVYSLCTVGLAEFGEASGRDPHSETFPTLNKGTLGVYYRNMMGFLVSGTKKSLSALGSDKKKLLETWSTAINVFNVLVTTLKNYDSRYLLGPCLKYSRLFLELFLRSAMPVLDSCLSLYNQDVTILFKNLQSSTRLLQHVCTHSKVHQDTSLIRYVPLLKRCLETLVYRVKAMLVINKCSEAFWMGNLKNRDLQGEELLSQSAREETEQEEEEEEDGEQEVEVEESDVDLDDEESEKSKSTSRVDEDATNYSVSF